VTVALLGDGGDEGFAGYDWYRTATTLGAADAITTVPGVASLIRLVARPMGRRARRLAALATADPAARFADLRSLFAPHATKPLFTSRFDESLDVNRLAAHRLRTLYNEGLDSLLAMQYVDLRTYLADELLPKVDVCTMAHSLEARAPLLDHRLLEFAYGLPPSLRDVRRPKRLLRRLLAQHVPVELTEGPKRGFSVPLCHWFRTDLKNNIRDLQSGVLAETGWIDRKATASLIENHLSAKRDNSERLFHLLVLDQWLAQ